MAGKKGFGAKLGYMVLTVNTPIANITKISPFALKADATDTTSHDTAVDANGNAWREKIPTLLDAGQAKFDLNYDPAAASHVALEGMVGVVQTFKVTMPPSTPAVVWTFSGFVSEVSPELPSDNKMTCSAVITISGALAVGTT